MRRERDRKKPEESGARPAWLREVLPFPGRYVTVGESRVHYLDEGSGPPLLLLTSSPVWCLLYRGMVRELRGAFRCIVPDFPGFGLSPPDGQPVTLMRQSSFVHELARALGLSEIILMVLAESRNWLEDLRRNLEGLPIPTLLLWGEHDRGVALGVIEDFQSLLPCSEAVIVKGGGHFAPEDVPEEMARQLVAWWPRVAKQ